MTYKKSSVEHNILYKSIQKILTIFDQSSNF